MAEIIKELVLDVGRENRIQAILGKQYDCNSRFLKVTLANEGMALSVPSGSVVSINAARPDGKSNSFLGEVNTDGTVTVPLSRWMLMLDGVVDCDISVTDSSGRRLSTANFTVEVESANVANGALDEVTASIGSSTGITSAPVNGTAFIAKVGTDAQATYTFTYESSSWTLNSTVVSLGDYGITVEGTPEQGDVVVITVSEVDDYDLISLLIRKIDEFDVTVEAAKTAAQNAATSAAASATDAQNAAQSAKSIHAIGAFSIAVSDWTAISNSALSPFTATALINITLTETISEDTAILVSFNDIFRSAGVVLSTASGESTMALRFYAVTKPEYAVKGTIAGVV